MPGRIGPNALVQTAFALEERLGRDAAGDLLAACGFATLFAEPPREMVPETDFAALVAGLVARLGTDVTVGVLSRAGRRTAEYVLANRIPRAAQGVIRTLPRPLALPLLLGAIGANARTFGESGTYRWSTLGAARIALANPAFSREPRVAAAVCAFRRAAFERLIRELVAAPLRLRERACVASGAAACAFTIEPASPADG